MTRIVLALLLLAPAAVAVAQPPGGPAKRLYVRNGTKVTATFDVVRHEGANVIVTTTTLAPNQDIEFRLKEIKGDRVLVAGSGNASRPWKVYGQATFNGADHPFPSVGYVLQQDEDGHIELVALLQGGVGAKALPEKTEAKSIEENGSD